MVLLLVSGNTSYSIKSDSMEAGVEGALRRIHQRWKFIPVKNRYLCNLFSNSLDPIAE